MKSFADFMISRKYRTVIPSLGGSISKREVELAASRSQKRVSTTMG